MAKESKIANVTFSCYKWSGRKGDNIITGDKVISIKYDDIKDLIYKIRMYKKSGILLQITENVYGYIESEDIINVKVEL